MGIIIGVIGEFLFYVFVEVFFDLVCYGIGKAVVKTVTRGRHPQPGHSRFLVALVGSLILIGLAIAVLFLIGYVVNPSTHI